MMEPLDAVNSGDVIALWCLSVATSIICRSPHIEAAVLTVVTVASSTSL